MIYEVSTLRALLASGWTLVEDKDGLFWAARKGSAPRRVFRNAALVVLKN